jgi:hypothetical protein
MNKTMLTPDEQDVLVDALTRQVKNPARAVVNHEAAFVAHHLSKVGYESLSAAYWKWVCMYRSEDPLRFGDEVDKLQARLDYIDKTTSMPSWGTYGT